MSSSTVYLIMGANRPNGIGAVLTSSIHSAFVKLTHSALDFMIGRRWTHCSYNILATHENAFVYAGTRYSEGSTALKELADKYPGRISVVKCISGDSTGNLVVAKEIAERHGHVDTVIANAGMAGLFGQVHEIPPREMEEHFRVNVMGPVVLFQSMYALLKKSDNPRFISMSSVGGSLTTGVVNTPIGAVSYGSTKAALNWVTRKIHFENEWLVAFPMHPVGVATDMLGYFINKDSSGVFKTFLTGDEPNAAKSAISILKLIDESTREKDGGQFHDVDGTRIPW